MTTEEASIMLTPSERGALHNYIIKTAKEQHKVHGVETDTLLTADFQEIVKKKALGMCRYIHILHGHSINARSMKPNSV